MPVQWKACVRMTSTTKHAALRQTSLPCVTDVAAAVWGQLWDGWRREPREPETQVQIASARGLSRRSRGADTYCRGGMTHSLQPSYCLLVPDFPTVYLPLQQGPFPFSLSCISLAPLSQLRSLFLYLLCSMHWRVWMVFWVFCMCIC